MIFSHPQSALSKIQKERFSGLPYFDYDQGFRFEVEPVSIQPEDFELQLELEGQTSLRRFADVSFSLSGVEQRFSFFWLSGYGGGIFLPFRYGTNETTTYGGGGYLLDTIKGADLGREGKRLILDFNYAYKTSCVYDARWHCPLPPPENTISLPGQAGEMTYPDPE